MTFRDPSNRGGESTRVLPRWQAYLEVASLGPPLASRSVFRVAARAMGLGAGSRVALPVWGCARAAEALAGAGCELLALDVDPHTGRVDVSDVARLREDFELLWIRDVDGLPPEAASLGSLARSRDALVVEEVCESLGGLSRGENPGAQSDLVLVHGPDGAVRLGSCAPDAVREAMDGLSRMEWPAEPGDPVLDSWLLGLPGVLVQQRRLAALWESAWGPLEALALPEFSEGTRGTWPRYTVRVLSGDQAMPAVAWARWLRARGVQATVPSPRLLGGLDLGDPETSRRFPGACEYLRRALSFDCAASLTLEEAERTVYAVDELARQESGRRAA